MRNLPANIDFLAKKRENIYTMQTNNAETGNTPEGAVEQKALVVTQPQKLEGLLETINLLNTVSERIGEDKSGDLGGGSGGGSQKGDDDNQQSARDKAIANLPSATVMHKELESHIQKEVKKLRKEVKKANVKTGKPGSAYKVNELYARMRRLNGVLAELLHASIEVIQRLYIRIFIDKQPVF